jgi:hypothetical protein
MSRRSAIEDAGLIAELAERIVIPGRRAAANPECASRRIPGSGNSIPLLPTLVCVLG